MILARDPDQVLLVLDRRDVDRTALFVADARSDLRQHLVRREVCEPAEDALGKSLLCLDECLGRHGMGCALDVLPAVGVQADWVRVVQCADDVDLGIERSKVIDQMLEDRRWIGPSVEVEILALGLGEFRSCFLGDVAGRLLAEDRWLSWRRGF